MYIYIHIYIYLYLYKNIFLKNYISLLYFHINLSKLYVKDLKEFVYSSIEIIY